MIAFIAPSVFRDYQMFWQNRKVHKEHWLSIFQTGDPVFNRIKKLSHPFVKTITMHELMRSFVVKKKMRSLSLAWAAQDLKPPEYRADPGV